MKHEKLLERAKDRYKTASEAWSENRELALEDLRFAKLGEQWPEDILREREIEARPALTFNKLPTIIRQVVNDARLNSPSIVVHPVDDHADVDTAEVVNGLIKNIQNSSQSDVATDNAIDASVSTGFGWFRVDLDYAMDDSFDLDIKIEPILNQFSVIPYPHSQSVDASDWMYCFIETDMSHDEFKSSYPNAKISDWHSDKDGTWLSEDQVKVAEYWEREEIDTTLLMLQDGTLTHQEKYEAEPALQVIPVVKSRPAKTYKVMQYIMTGEEVLETNEWPGKFIPVVPVYGEEVNDGEKRLFKSLIRDVKDAQMNYNFQRTAYTERTGLGVKAPYIGPVGAFDTDSRKWETANKENWPYLEYDGNIPPQQVMPPMPDSGLMQDIMASSQEIKDLTGIHEAGLGMKSNETSGKAILARQREGDISTAHFIDNLSRAIKYAGRVILDLLPSVYNTPRIVRVMGYDGKTDQVKVNQEFIQGTATKLHDLTLGKYDLVVKTGPSFSTQREEALTQMTQIVQAYPDAVPIIGDLLVSSMDWPGADEMAKRLKAMLPPQIQALEKVGDDLPPEAQAKLAQMQQQMKQMGELIQKGQQVLKEKDEQIKELQLANKDKSGELSVKVADIEKKYEIEMAKINKDLEIARAKIKEDQRELIVETTLEAMKLRIDSLGETIQGNNLDMASREATSIATGTDALAAAIAALANRSGNKTMEIMAPSGEVYQGSVIEE